MLKNYSFPKERVFGFTDAVFSIAITLLVLDIELPSVEVINQRGIGLTLQYLIPDFIGFFVSFMVIALYWKFYLIYSRYIKVFDTKLLQINTFILLFVALVPFSTAFFVDSFDSSYPFTFYCGNLSMLGLFMYIQLKVVLKRAKVMLDPIDAEYLKFRGVLAFLFWLAVMGVSFLHPLYPKLVIPLIFIIQVIGKWYFNRKFNKH